MASYIRFYEGGFLHGNRNRIDDIQNGLPLEVIISGSLKLVTLNELYETINEFPELSIFSSNYMVCKSYSRKKPTSSQP